MQEHIYQSEVSESELAQFKEITVLYNAIGNNYTFSRQLPGNSGELVESPIRGNAHVIVDIFEQLFPSCSAHHGLYGKVSHAWLTNSKGHIIDIIPVGAISPPVLVFQVFDSVYDRSVSTDVAWRKSPEYLQLIKDFAIEFAPWLGRSDIE